MECPRGCTVCDQGNMEDCPAKVFTVDVDHPLYEEITEAYKAWRDK